MAPSFAWPAKPLTTALAAAGIAVTGCVAYYAVRELRRQRKLLEYKRALLPNADALAQLKADFMEHMALGLQGKPGGSLMMLPTFITHLPRGSEAGECYAIDLGGTNFRVAYVKALKGGVLEEGDMHEVAIPKRVYTGTGEQLFDFLAAELKDFIAKRQAGQQPSGARPVVGFCFSFALEQTGLASGRLLTWTKGFTCSGCVGSDPVQQLSQALARAGCPCDLAIVINDTVGVLAAGRFYDPDTQVGIIVGTGTNACYVERAGAVSKWTSRPAGVSPDTPTAINVEWGGFTSPALPRCYEDVWLDCASKHPKQYLTEKLVAGMYMGEAARRIIHTFAADAAIFGASVPPDLAKDYGFSTAQLASIVEDSSPWLSTVQATLQQAFGVGHCSYSVRRLVQEVCATVAMRSALMVAMMLDAILTHSGWYAAPRRAVIAVDGGVYDNFCAYRAMLRAALRRVMGDDKAQALAHLVEFKGVHDGSAIGAAVLALAEGGAAGSSGSFGAPAGGGSGSSGSSYVKLEMDAATVAKYDVNRDGQLQADELAAMLEDQARTAVAAASIKQ